MLTVVDSKMKKPVSKLLYRSVKRERRKLGSAVKKPLRFFRQYKKDIIK